MGMECYVSIGLKAFRSQCTRDSGLGHSDILSLIPAQSVEDMLTIYRFRVLVYS
jgi:hypothetical protein